MQQDTNKTSATHSPPLTVAGIVDLLVQGYSFPQVIDAHPDTVHKLPAVADYFDSLASMPTGQTVGFCMEAMRDLYRRSLEIGDLANAKSCIVELSKMAKASAAPAQRKNATRPKTIAKSSCR